MQGEKVSKHMNLYKKDVEAFEKMFGEEHGLFSQVTREVFHNFIEKELFMKKKKKKRGKG